MTAWPEGRMEFVCTAPAEKGEDGQRWLPRNPRGYFIYLVFCPAGEDLFPRPCIRHMGCYIFPCLRTVQPPQHDVHVDALPYGLICLELEFLLPEFRLSHKHQRHRACGVKFIIQQEPQFFQHVLPQQVRFIQHAHDFLFLLRTDRPDFLLQRRGGERDLHQRGRRRGI